MSLPNSTTLHHRWHIQGQVQGVGFRPFVYRLATQHHLVGAVRNDTAGVVIDAWANLETLDRFEHQLLTTLPPLASIDRMQRESIDPPGPPPPSFSILASDTTTAVERGRVTVDCATCPDCRRELFNPTDRRYRHGLINCTNCGPRFTIVRDLPYDRAATTMRDFAMCNQCAHEYANPADRRFHAQPVCCHDCGPQVRIVRPDGSTIDADPYLHAADMLRRGSILAIKALGGYHLACRADDPHAVAELRRRKHRDHKPFAVLARDLDHARTLVRLSPAAEAELTASSAPIILAPTNPGAPVAPGVAPRSHRLGVMLASTPIQHLLMAQHLPPLVMTSANRSDEPLVKDDADALSRLDAIADAILLHDRPIERAVDDSVLLDSTRGLVMFRRARGYVPAPLSLPVRSPAPGLCVGAELKNTVGLVDETHAVLSQHVGDLSQMLAYERFVRTIEDMQRLFAVEPRWVACDRHPGYLSRRFAQQFARRRGIPLFQIQHHHAHAASLLVEHGLDQPIVAIVCDGVGYGDDGAAWGGEILIADLKTSRRVARLRPLLLPGGDAAARQTGRCAFAWLFDRFGHDAITHPLAARVLPDPAERQIIAQMLAAGLQCPPSSGAGRLFDAAASLLGLCDFNHHEAMSGQLLESAAAAAEPTTHPATFPVQLWKPPAPHNAEANDLGELDHRPLLDHLLSGLTAGEPVTNLAWTFHHALARALADAAAWAAAHAGLHTVGLTGGVFCNQLLTTLLAQALHDHALHVLTHARIPPNDGGLSLGQAGISAKLQSEV